MDALIRNIRCPECAGILRGTWQEVSCGDCDATYSTLPLLGLVDLRQGEVGRFTTTGALVAMTSAQTTAEKEGK